jgi:hypothetical protein
MAVPSADSLPSNRGTTGPRRAIRADAISTIRPASGAAARTRSAAISQARVGRDRVWKSWSSADRIEITFLRSAREWGTGLLSVHPGGTQSLPDQRADVGFLSP